MLTVAIDGDCCNPLTIEDFLKNDLCSGCCFNYISKEELRVWLDGLNTLVIGTTLIDDAGSRVSSHTDTPVEEDVSTPPQES
uniref:Uncharacterized protein n=1 Tax=Cannabis sativa TaxID=3483 RepID=A0A803PBQ8_CANSA